MSKKILFFFLFSTACSLQAAQKENTIHTLAELKQANREVEKTQFYKRNANPHIGVRRTIKVDGDPIQQPQEKK